MRGGSHELLLQMESTAQKLINTDKLKNLLQWSEQITEGSEGTFKPAAKRSAAIYITLSFADNSIDRLATSRGLHFPSVQVRLSGYFDGELNLAVATNAFALLLEKRLNQTLSLFSSESFTDFALPYSAEPHVVDLSDLNMMFDYFFYFIQEIEKSKVFYRIDYEILTTQLEDLKLKFLDNSQNFDLDSRQSLNTYALLCLLTRQTFIAFPSLLRYSNSNE